MSNRFWRRLSHLFGYMALLLPVYAHALCGEYRDQGS